VLFSLAWALIISWVCILDLLGVTGILTQQREFREAGATVQVISGAGGISADRCISLSGIHGVSGAMALRASPSSFALSTLPSNPPALFEASGDLAHFFPSLNPLNSRVSSQAGVLLSASLAERLGAKTNSVLALRDGSVVVREVFPWPRDGRASILDGAAVAEVPTSGRFDECWVDVWPPDNSTRTLLLAATIPDPNIVQPPNIAQLNPSLGPGSDTAELLATRLTSVVRYAAIPIAFGLGLLNSLVRRVEIASSLHAGARRAEVNVQIALESTVWSAVAALAAAATLVAMARRLTTAEDMPAVVEMQLATVLAGTAATIFGAIAGIALVRSKSLFRYARDR
jgi:hypothetical protein